MQRSAWHPSSPEENQATGKSSHQQLMGKQTLDCFTILDYTILSATVLSSLHTQVILKSFSKRKWEQHSPSSAFPNSSQGEGGKETHLLLLQHFLILLPYDSRINSSTKRYTDHSINKLFHSIIVTNQNCSHRGRKTLVWMTTSASGIKVLGNCSLTSQSQYLWSFQWSKGYLFYAAQDFLR